MSWSTCGARPGAYSRGRPLRRGLGAGPRPCHPRRPGRPGRRRDYLTHKAPYLDYPTALASGWPVASGIIEGACRDVVGDSSEFIAADRWPVGAPTIDRESPSASLTANVGGPPRRLGRGTAWDRQGLLCGLDVDSRPPVRTHYGPGNGLCCTFVGGDDGTRTHDPLLAKQEVKEP